MKKYNKHDIMVNAWNMVREFGLSIGEALRIAWSNAKSIVNAKLMNFVEEECHTWYGWKKMGYEVIHESKAAFKVMVVDLKTKKGTRVLSYFLASQVHELENA